jgi:hypothetical protein
MRARERVPRQALRFVLERNNMSEQTNNSNQMLVIGLAVVAVLLVAIVGLLIWQQSQASQVPAPTVTTPAGGTGSGAAQMPATGAPAPVEVDPASATKVPEGSSPLEFVTEYHEAVQAGDYAKAYKMLPVEKQQSYGNAESYESQVKAYGISGFEIGEPVESEDTFSVDAAQITPQMPITYTWNFEKIDGTWYCASRVMAGK